MAGECDGHGGGPVVVGGRVWPRCPTAILAEPAARSVIRHLNEADISPLAGWPDAYAAWLVEGMREVQAHQAARFRHDTQKKKSGGGALTWL